MADDKPLVSVSSSNRAKLNSGARSSSAFSNSQMVRCGMKTVLSPAAIAGFMSDFGELPIIQVRPASSPFRRTSSR